MSLPHTGDCQLDLEAIKPFCDHIINSVDIAIEGGNDNSEDFRPLEGKYFYTEHAYEHWEKQNL